MQKKKYSKNTKAIYFFLNLTLKRKMIFPYFFISQSRSNASEKKLDKMYLINFLKDYFTLFFPGKDIFIFSVKVFEIIFLLLCTHILLKCEQYCTSSKKTTTENHWKIYSTFQNFKISIFERSNFR